MSINRRQFLHTSAAVGGALSLGIPRGLHAGAVPGEQSLAPLLPTRAPRALNMLILGGTSFIGPHFIHHALGRGHQIATFTRGRTQPTIYKDDFRHVESLIGDRADDHDALRGRTWDVVIDTSGWQLEWALNSIDAVKDSTDLYLYTSSVGVFLPYLKAGLTEEDDVLSEDPPSVAEAQRPTYGVMKVQSEAEVRRVFGSDRHIIVRPGYIAGPADSFNRYAYWPARLERGGEVLVPGTGQDPAQYTDVRDLAEFMVRCAENRTLGTYNVVGPASPLTVHAFVHGAHATMSSEVDWVMVDDHEFLQEHRHPMDPAGGRSVRFPPDQHGQGQGGGSHLPTGSRDGTGHAGVVAFGCRHRGAAAASVVRCPRRVPAESGAGSGNPRGVEAAVTLYG